MKSLAGQFADWVALKPADETYDYGDHENCALAQFLIAAGFAKAPRAGGDYWYENANGNFDGPKHAIPIYLANAIAGSPTFGALAERLKASA